MTKEKMKFTKEDIYVRRNLLSIGEIAGISLWIAGFLSIFIDFGPRTGLILLGVLIVIFVLIHIKRSAIVMEIHGDKIMYRNGRWERTEFSIYEIERIVLPNDEDAGITFIGKDDRELVSLNESMDEVGIALPYLESKGVPMSEELLLGVSYEEYYDACCKKAKNLLSTNDDEEVILQEMGFGRRRRKYFIKQEASNRKEAKIVAKQMRSNWKLKRGRLTEGSTAMEWFVNKKYLLSVSGEKESAFRLAKLRQYCMQEGIPVREIVSTKAGSPYLIENNWFGEVKEGTEGFNELTGPIKNKAEGDVLCYEAGVGLAKYQNILLTHPEFIKTDEPWIKKEYRIKRALTAKSSPLSQEEWKQLISEAESACEEVKKICVPIIDVKSIVSNKKRMMFTDKFLEASTECEVSIWLICSYMASLATHTYMVTRGIRSKCWCEYVLRMVEGYESIRPLTTEERECIPAMLRLAVALEMEEIRYDEEAREKLMQLYRYLEY